MRTQSRWFVLSLTAAVFIASGSAGSSLDERDSAPPEKYESLARTIREEGLHSEGAFKMLTDLVAAAGPRLPGSPAASAAVDHMRRVMDDLGWETSLEPTEVQHWVRGDEKAKIVGGPGERETELTISALGGSVPTPASGIRGRAVEVSSFEELDRNDSFFSGAIVFFNRPMDRSLVDAFRAYGEAARFRSEGPSRAARAGAAAVLVRSLTFRIDDYPHTGVLGYDSNAPKIPAAAVSTKDAEMLSRRLKENPGLTVELRLGCADLAPVFTSNVIGQVRGTEKPEEIVLIGAHLDSWDLAVGAHDDGAGCVQAVEALRLILKAGIKPKRTVRVVLFMNEEFGASGGRDYAAAPARKTENHIVAMESDRGGFLPLYVGIGGPPEVRAKFARHEKLFLDLGLAGIRSGGGGADIGPIVSSGAVPMGFVPAAQTYFDVHHSGLDTLDKVHPRELEWGAICLALLAVIASEEGI